MAVAILIAGSAGLTACSTTPPPPHVAVASSGDWAPEAGYAWVDSGDHKKGVVWTPGVESTAVAHLTSGDVEGRWGPSPGYAWVSDSDQDLRTVWQPDQQHPTFSHVRSASAEGQWLPDPGYVFAEAGTLSNGVWAPGLRDADYVHAYTTDREGMWRADPGYRFQRDGDLASAAWTPGTPHPSQDHVYAAAAEGSWRAAEGFAFANAAENDLTVMASSSDDPGEKLRRFLGNLLAAGVAQNFAAERDGDGLISTVFVRPLAGAIRDDRLRAAARELN